MFKTTYIEFQQKKLKNYQKGECLVNYKLKITSHIYIY